MGTPVRKRLRRGLVPSGFLGDIALDQGALHWIVPDTAVLGRYAPGDRRIQVAVLVSTGDRDQVEAVSRWWRGSAVVVPLPGNPKLLP